MGDVRKHKKNWVGERGAAAMCPARPSRLQVERVEYTAYVDKRSSTGRRVSNKPPVGTAAEHFLELYVYIVWTIRNGVFTFLVRNHNIHGRHCEG